MLFSQQTINKCDIERNCTTETVKGFQSYNMAIFQLYLTTFGGEVDRDVNIKIYSVSGAIHIHRLSQPSELKIAHVIVTLYEKDFEIFEKIKWNSDFRAFLNFLQKWGK